MNRFEQQIYDCTNKIGELLETTTKPLHRAILENFRRHILLEMSGQYDRIVASDMMADHPVYRVTWGTEPVVIEGKEGVKEFYQNAGKAVLWHSDDRLAVADWGISDEMTFYQLTKGDALIELGFEVDDQKAYYLYSSRQAFVWPYDEKARLIGEHLYEDKSSVKIEKLAPSEVITPERSAEIAREVLTKLESEKGDNFWVLDRIEAETI